MNFERSRSAPDRKNPSFFFALREWKRACFHADNVVELLYQCSSIFFSWDITSDARQLSLGKRGRALQTVAEKADITSYSPCISHTRRKSIWDAELIRSSRRIYSVTNVISAFDVYRLSATGSFPKTLLSRVTVLFQIKSLNQIPI